MKANEEKHPVESMLQIDSVPSIWCQGCGIGIVVNTFVQSVKKMNFGPDKICLLSSGIGCTGKIAEYLKFKSFNTTDSDVVSCVVDIKSKNPDLKVVAFLSDTDFIANGAGDFIEALKKGKDIDPVIIYINNYIYHIFMEHKGLKLTPLKANPSVKKTLSPFNIPKLARMYGAKYVARWTPLHPRRLMFSINDAFSNKGFSMIEVISPCLMYYMCEGRAGETIDRTELYYNNSIIKNNEPVENLDLRQNKKIIVGKFVNNE